MISDNLKDVYGEAGLRRLAAEQKAKLLPHLQTKQTKIAAKISGLGEELDAVEQAIETIEDGKITDYQLRKAPVRKPKKGGEA